ncbi:MAG: hypothetical protein JWP87_416 [Labilithrix sp.]|nr:hypothetical protein [Labilithrix sp.]
MSGFGWFLAFLGFLGLIGGLLQMFKGKKLNAVPFRAPSQIAQLGPQAADAKGLVSTEGAVSQQGLLTAPMSGRPCLAFEITVERKYETTERTENGTETKKGSSSLFSDYKGGIFALQDGQGTVLVDATTKPDASFEKAHDSGVNVGILGIIPGTLQFGNFQMATPLIVGEGRTTGFEGTEKIVPPSPNLYVLGALAMGPQGPVLHTPKGIGTGKLILSAKGRASLVKSTKTKMTVGYALGGVMFVSGTLLGIFGPAPDPSTASASSSCSSTLTTDVVACDGRMYEREGYDMKWTVATAGEYTLTVTQPKVKYPIDPSLTINDASGKQVAHAAGFSKGAEAKVTQRFEPGTYTINVKDVFNDKVKGGYGFHLDVARTPDAPAPVVASAAITNAEVPGNKPVAKAAGAAVKGAPAKSGAAASAGKPSASASTKPAAAAPAAAASTPKK